MTAITIAQLADRLAVSRMTIHRMRQAAELPPTLNTSRRWVRWLDADIEFWLEMNCPKAADFISLKQTKQKFSRRQPKS